MESEKQEAEKATESQESFLTKKVGNIEKEKLQAVPILVKDVSVQDQFKKDTGKKVGKMLHLMCKHPDKEELIDMSKILYRKTEKEAVKELGLWYNEDKEGNIQMGSAIDDVLKFFKVDSLTEIEGKTCHTIVESKTSSFLCLKLFN